MEIYRGIIPRPFKVDHQEWIKEQQGTKEEYATANLSVTRREDGILTYCPNLNLQLIIVPPEKRKLLTTYCHEMKCHVQHSKIYSHMAKTYHWPTMKADVRKWLSTCSLCNMLHARKNLAHGHFRANPHSMPRTTWAADYYGVAQSDDGYNNILGYIDLATLYLVLSPQKTRTGGDCTRSLLYDIILPHGVPIKFHTDAAQEFLGRAMGRLCQMTGIRKTDTLGHSPQSNGTIENAWKFIDLCLTSMTDEEYRVWPLYLPLIAHLWNNTIRSATGITPFEAAHGMKARTITDAFIPTKLKKESRAMTHDEVEIVRKSAKAMSKIAYNMLANQKTEQAIALNKGKKGQNFKVGDLVTFFKPPTQAEAKRRQRKVKHCFYHHGPAKLTLALSNTTFELTYRKRIYQRSIRNLRKYRAGKISSPAPKVYALPPDQVLSVKVGNLVAVKDSNDPKDLLFHIAMVDSISDEHLKVRYFGTTSRNPKQVKFRPIWIDPSDSKLRFTKPKVSNALANKHRFTGTLEMEDGGIPSLVLLPKVTLYRGTMDQQHWDALAERGYKHHVTGQTYQ